MEKKAAFVSDNWRECSIATEGENHPADMEQTEERVGAQSKHTTAKTNEIMQKRKRP